MEKEARLMSAKEACIYLGLGRNRGVEFAKSIGAEVAIGRRRLYDKVVIDRYLDKHANYAQTECQFRYCGTAIPFLTVRSTAR